MVLQNRVSIIMFEEKALEHEKIANICLSDWITIWASLSQIKLSSKANVLIDLLAFILQWFS
jgi:hypothetical protein